MEINYEKACHCALNRIFGFEPKIALALISHLGGAGEVFRLGRKEIDSLLGPHSKYAGSISDEAVDKAYIELETLERYGIRFIGWGEDNYPELLKECEDPPTGLYIKSSSPIEELWNNRRMISIIGTRDLSPYGKEWCERIVSSLADTSSENRPTIVSGLALGVDICAHNAALKYGLPTIAVMATGPETIYPSRHRTAGERIAQTSGSALITDYPPETAPLAIHFLRRNRIIAGMSPTAEREESVDFTSCYYNSNLVIIYKK
jgi:DNA processing protein